MIVGQARYALEKLAAEFPNAPRFVWERDVQDTELPTVRRVVVRVIWDERQPNACELLYFIRDRREPDANP